MKPTKVMTVLGTRPEIIRLAVVLKKLDQHFSHVLVHTGQNHDYELNTIFFEDLDLRKPDYFLGAARPTAAETIGQIITRVDPVLQNEAPQALLLLGDTNSCLSAIPAKRRRIPIFHMEAGNRCFDQRVPEETNRRIVDHVSDINLPYSRIAREYLLREGLPPDRVITTGSPMLEVLRTYRPKIDRSEILQRLGLRANGYYLVSAHREENIEPQAQFDKLVLVLVKLVKNFGNKVVVSTHPRTRNRLKGAQHDFPDRILFLKPFAFTDYVHLQQNAIAVLSDSGTISEESSILGFPALNIREAHERPEAMEEAAVIMTGLRLDRVMEGLELLQSQRRDAECVSRRVADYDVPNVSDKVVRILLSYIDYVHRCVWYERR